MDPIRAWHDYVERRDPALLEALIADDAVFESPAVHTPQLGKAITVKYLTAAMNVLGNDSFRYLHEWHSDGSVVLEFACELDGLSVNGVDMINWGADGRITALKVMVRPVKALYKVMELMGAELAKG